jgi:hypothetical protein
MEVERVVSYCNAPGIHATSFACSFLHTWATAWLHEDLDAMPGVPQDVSSYVHSVHSVCTSDVLGMVQTLN